MAGMDVLKVLHLCFFAILNTEQNSSYLQLCRRLYGKMLVLVDAHNNDKKTWGNVNIQRFSILDKINIYSIIFLLPWNSLIRGQAAWEIVLVRRPKTW